MSAQSREHPFLQGTQVKSSRDLEAELIGLRSSLRLPSARPTELAQRGIGWIKDEIDHTMPAELRERLSKWRDDTEAFLSAHPIASAAIALCIGFALGQLWRRHHDR